MGVGDRYACASPAAQLAEVQSSEIVIRKALARGQDGHFQSAPPQSQKLCRRRRLHEQHREAGMVFEQPGNCSRH